MIRWILILIVALSMWNPSPVSARTTITLFEVPSTVVECMQYLYHWKVESRTPYSPGSGGEWVTIHLYWWNGNSGLVRSETLGPYWMANHDYVEGFYWHSYGSNDSGPNNGEFEILVDSDNGNQQIGYFPITNNIAC